MHSSWQSLIHKLLLLLLLRSFPGRRQRGGAGRGRSQRRRNQHQGRRCRHGSGWRGNRRRGGGGGGGGGAVASGGRHHFLSHLAYLELEADLAREQVHMFCLGFKQQLLYYGAFFDKYRYFKHYFSHSDAWHQIFFFDTDTILIRQYRFQKGLRISSALYLQLKIKWEDLYNFFNEKRFNCFVSCQITDVFAPTHRNWNLCIPRKGIARPQCQNIFPRSAHLFSSSRIGRPIRGIFKSLTGTWM